jgi:apolipoprotein D and lipocalin family protein
MSRSPQASPAKMAMLTNKLRDLGYDIEKLRRVPQQWPGTESQPAAGSDKPSSAK